MSRQAHDRDRRSSAVYVIHVEPTGDGYRASVHEATADPQDNSRPRPIAAGSGAAATAPAAILAAVLAARIPAKIADLPQLERRSKGSDGAGQPCTVLASAELPIELHSSYLGHPGTVTRAAHLTITPGQTNPLLAEHDHDQCPSRTRASGAYSTTCRSSSSSPPNSATRSPSNCPTTHPPDPTAPASCHPGMTP